MNNKLDVAMLHAVIREDADWAKTAAVWERLKREFGIELAFGHLMGALVIAASEMKDPGAFLAECANQLINNPLCVVPS